MGLLGVAQSMEHYPVDRSPPNDIAEDLLSGFETMHRSSRLTILIPTIKMSPNTLVFRLTLGVKNASSRGGCLDVLAEWGVVPTRQALPFLPYPLVSPIDTALAVHLPSLVPSSTTAPATPSATTTT
jgi:hypothetical protein